MSRSRAAFFAALAGAAAIVLAVPVFGATAVTSAPPAATADGHEWIG